MATQLRKGTKVMIIPSSRFYGVDIGNPAETIGTIMNIEKDAGNILPIRVVWATGAVNTYAAEDLARVSKTTSSKPKFTKTVRSLKIGDTVKIVKNLGGHYFPIGCTGVVKATNPPSKATVVENSEGCWAVALTDIKVVEPPVSSKKTTTCNRTKKATKPQLQETSTVDTASNLQQ